MTKEFWFDMDGTIADLYGVPEWLMLLREESPLPYVVARPLVNMSRLARALHKVQRNGYTVNIISWTAKDGSAEYNKAVEKAKREWLAKHLPSVSWDRIVIVNYGTAKSSIGRGVLFDDNDEIKEDWGENAYNPSEIFEVLATV